MRIMIAVDETPESHHAVDVAFGLFGGDANYTICSIADQPLLYPIESPVGGFGAVGDLRALYEASAASARATAGAAQDDIPGGAEVVVESGSPGPTICALAAEHSIQFIVIGSHDRSFWDRLFQASVGRYVVEHAPCPVVVVR